MNDMETILIIGYLFVAFLLRFETKVCIYALVSFGLSSLCGKYMPIDSLLNHALYFLLMVPLCLTDRYSLKITAFTYCLLQYIMMLDVYFNPTTETFWYNIYPYAAFIVHLAIIITVFDHGVKQLGRFNADIDRAFTR